MDFKSYVKMILEAEEAEDKNKKAEDEDLDDEDDDEDEDDDDEDEEASVRTKGQGCTGSEASVADPVGDGDEDDDDEDEDDETDDKEDDEEEEKSLKESIIYSSRYLSGYARPMINEEEKERVRVLCESIKNNSASNFLSKLASKASKDASKLEAKGKKDKAKIAKDSAKQLKEASNKIRKAEDKYKAGDPAAKKEYKDLCKQYHKELKKQGRVARGIRNTVLSLVAGSALLGTAGLTALANDDIVPRLKDGIEDGNLGEVLKGMAVKDAEALKKIADAADEGIIKDKLHNIYDHGKFEYTRKGIKDAVEEIDRNAYKNDGYHDKRENAADFAGKVGSLFGAKNKDGKPYNYKDMFGDKKKK